MVEGDREAERPRHGSGQFIEVFGALPALQPCVVDFDQAVLVLDPEDELASDPGYLGEDLLVIQPGVTDKAQRRCPARGPG